MRPIKSAVLGVTACVASLFFGVISDAVATVYNPASLGLTGWTVTPGGFSASAYSDDSQGDVNPMNVANVETTLEGALWFNAPLTAVTVSDQQNCGSGGVTCGGSGSNNTGAYSGAGANVFGVHFDSQFIAFLYAAAISNFSISGLLQGVSGVYAYCSLTNCDTGGGGGGGGVVPLPPALILFASALVGMAILGRRRVRAIG